jgi:DNA primase
MGQYIDFRFVKANASFDALLQRYRIETKGTGDERTALCPFHEESKPSFKVNLRKGGFHCFGCGAKGNVLDFVAKLEGCDLREAAVIVAEASGISLSERTEGAETRLNGRKGAGAHNRPETAPTAPQAATGARKRAAPGKETAEEPPPARPERNAPLSFRLKLDPAHPYLRSRLSGPLIQHFELGYCDRGLLKSRIAIPIHDDDGELVAYAGRWADADVPEDVEKYLLPLKFRKSLVLFNLSRLARPVEHVVVVEGFFGAMRLHGLGIPVVAAHGQLDLGRASFAARRRRRSACLAHARWRCAGPGGGAHHAAFPCPFVLCPALRTSRRRTARHRRRSRSPRTRSARNAVRYRDYPQEPCAPAGSFSLRSGGASLKNLGSSLGRVEHAQDLDHLALDAVPRDLGFRAHKSRTGLWSTLLYALV